MATVCVGGLSSTRADGAAPLHAHRAFGHDLGWYLVAGVLTTATQGLLYLMLRAGLGAHAANLVSLAITTYANTEFHRRVTFAGASSSSLRRHAQSLLTFAFYAGYGTVVLLTLHLVLGETTPAVETLVLVSANGVGGALRFFALRSWVFITR